MAQDPVAPVNGASRTFQGGEAFDLRRLQMLLTFSASLRWPMISTALVMAAVMWVGGAPPVWVVAWALLAVAVRELRAARLARLRSDETSPIAERMKSAEWWTLLLGAAYGSAALFMPGLDTASVAILTMVLMSLSSGAVSTSFSIVRAFVAFAAGVAVPTAVMWMVTRGWIGWGVAALILMFLGVQIKFARQNMMLFQESYAMRLENDVLLRDLSAERVQLEQARDAAVQADLAKSRFLASASHDLRQPLQSLLLNSGALSRMPIDGESRAIAKDIGDGIEALRQMLDALLDISQLDAGAVAPRFQEVALAALLEGVCAQFRPAAQAKGLYLTCECETSEGSTAEGDTALAVTSDAHMLRRILANLVDNAIKFTRSGGIALAARVEGDYVALTVADTGIGMGREDRHRVFDDLVQLRNPQRARSSGHGLGLGIVRRLTQLLGVACTIESEPDQGTRFVLRLPRAGGGPSRVSDRPWANAAPIARRLLVLDDDAEVRASYARALTSLGCQVVCAATLIEALDALPRHEPEMALVDFRLAEDCDGLQAIAGLRAARPALAAVIVSADVSQALKDQAARAAVTVLRKPVTDAMLASTINGALQSVIGDATGAPRRGPPS